jgi:hypothetical protein
MAQSRPARDAALIARILRFCRFCGRETAHEVRAGSLGPRVACLKCRERALLEELDRD